MIDTCVHAHGGVRPVEQGEGDSTVSVFSLAAPALAAALDVQLTGAREVWPDDAAVGAVPLALADAAAGTTGSGSAGSVKSVGVAEEDHNRRLLRARDMIDLQYRLPLDVAALAAVACMSQAHFIRSFKTAFGETPHRYLQRRRIERATAQLRCTDRTVSEVCVDVGWSSFATFSRTFREVVGCSPSEYRTEPRVVGDEQVPTCFVKAWTRPATSSTFGTGGAVDAA